MLLNTKNDVATLLACTINMMLTQSYASHQVLTKSMFRIKHVVLHKMTQKWTYESLLSFVAKKLKNQMP